MEKVDFLAVGDVVVDDFIRLKEAEVHCNINKEECTICMRFGDKVPFESSTKVYGVGNAGNAAIAATRLGLKTALIANIGKDQNGDLILDYYKKEGLDTTYITQHEDVPTNYHYVLWYGDERTILIKQNNYSRAWPKNVAPPKTLYYSSTGEHMGAYQDDIVSFAEKHPDMFFAFQPGVFDIKAGVDAMRRFYARANFFVCNKEESMRVLNSKEEDVQKLAEGIHALGPKIVIITNGVDGTYSLADGNFVHTPMFPDPKPPLQRTGAGDAFASTTAAFLTMGMSLGDSIARGLVNSAYVVQQIGAQRGLLTKEEIEKHLAENSANPR